ncbi:unnamed protein product [Musa acuminata subsp. malaccensis]|uniref:(wild Malaysian banana) hypothetical protein n=1 Tax=Musa acuminata subsp. malaccensis TaxID=214687 RepID=A0A804JTR4_MUSAM|nr:unnamed protein product [Musa acuminata subsp. malaccensis]
MVGGGINVEATTTTPSRCCLARRCTHTTSPIPTMSLGAFDLASSGYASTSPMLGM